MKLEALIGSVEPFRRAARGHIFAGTFASALGKQAQEVTEPRNEGSLTVLLTIRPAESLSASVRCRHLMVRQRRGMAVPGELAEPGAKAFRGQPA